MSIAKFAQALFLLLVGSASFFAARPAQAQTETVIYNFTIDSAFSSSSLTPDGKGNFYGTAPNGAYGGCGNVFEFSPDGRGGWNATTIYSFTGGSKGCSALSNVIIDSAGNLYGTLFGGGANCCGGNGGGVVYKLHHSSTGWTEAVLHRFAGGKDGGQPVGGLIMDPAGHLYGTTSRYGSYSTGTVFELTKSSSGWTERVIYEIDHKLTSNFYNPGLTMDAAGNIFGASDMIVFKLSPNGSGGWKTAVIYTFPSGWHANSTPVLDQAGNVYGTTYKGGANNAGTAYKLSPGKTGTWTAKVLHAFGSGQDGAYSWGGVVLDASGNVYGTTLYGGTFNAGTVYELSPSGRYSYTEKILWSFNSTDGFAPYGALVRDSAGDLYGTTQGGGAGYPFGQGYGVAFEITP